jgi:hypothetical protein
MGKTVNSAQTAGEKFQFGGNSIKLQNINQMNVLDYIDEFISGLNQLSSIFDEKTDTDILNIRDEMLQEANHLKYLLSLQ